MLGQCDDVGINECPQIPQQHYKKGSQVYELGNTILEALKESKSGLTGLEGLADKYGIRKSRQFSDMSQIIKMIWWCIANEVDPSMDSTLCGALYIEVGSTSC